MTGCLVAAAACGRSPDPSSTPAIRLTTPPDGAPAYVELTGLADGVLNDIDDASLTPEQWTGLLRVAVERDGPPVLGAYGVADGALRFTPMFPFDQGRQYLVRFDPARLPGGATGGAPIETAVGRPASTAVPSTVVTRVYPSGDTVPENMLRMYVEFSAPMGRKSGVEYLTLLDHAGQEIPGAVLPLDYEFWSPDHRRFTVFFDPGRVKKGILPNRQMGRPLEIGRTVTLVISRDWRDEHGQPLKEEHRRRFTVGPADERPLDTASWRIESPAAGTRAGVVVRFAEPLDHGLLMRALGVRRNDQSVDGSIVVDEAETRWTFTPTEPWRAGGYQLLALDILEDLAGNQIGRAFEVDNFDTVDKSPNPESIMIPFVVK